MWSARCSDIFHSRDLWQLKQSQLAVRPRSAAHLSFSLFLTEQLWCRIVSKKETLNRFVSLAQAKNKQKLIASIDRLLRFDTVQILLWHSGWTWPRIAFMYSGTSLFATAILLHVFVTQHWYMFYFKKVIKLQINLKRWAWYSRVDDRRQPWDFTWFSKLPILTDVRCELFLCFKRFAKVTRCRGDPNIPRFCGGIYTYVNRPGEPFFAHQKAPAVFT